MAEVKLFTEGFLIEKMNGLTSLPMLISFERHVESVWTVESADLFSMALGMSAFTLSTFPALSVPGGLLMVFQLNAVSAAKFNADGYPMFNSVAESLPFTTTTTTSTTTVPNCVGLFIQSGARAASTMMNAFVAWRSAFRLHGVKEAKGGEKIPHGMLTAFLQAVDMWNMSPSDDSYGDRDLVDHVSTSLAKLPLDNATRERSGSRVRSNSRARSNSNAPRSRTNSNAPRSRTISRDVNNSSMKPSLFSYGVQKIPAASLVSIAKYFTQFPMLHVVGMGYLPMRLVEMII